MKACKESNAHPQMLSILIKSLSISQQLKKPLLAQFERDISKKPAIMLLKCTSTTFSKDIWTKSNFFKEIRFCQNVDIYWDIKKMIISKWSLKKTSYVLFLECWYWQYNICKKRYNPSSHKITFFWSKCWYQASYRQIRFFL